MSNTLHNPKISIIIPVYNGSNYLEKSINCALAQTYENTEVIVINDGSADGGATAEIARSYGDRITYIEKENGGVSSALNIGIQRMTGAYFSWLSHDDEYNPEKIADSVEALRKVDCLDGRTIAYTGHYQIDQNSEVLKTYQDDFESNRVYSSDEMIKYCASHQTLNGCCMLIPVELLRQIGGFDEHLRYSQDLLMWFRLFFGGARLTFDGKVNVGYRLHRAQTSRTKHELFEKDNVYIAKEIAASFALFPNGAEIAFSYANRLARYGVKEAVEVMGKAAVSAGKPFSFKQKAVLKCGLFFSKFRSRIKNIYYRLFLKATV